jgi:hypothetical protein
MHKVGTACTVWLLVACGGAKAPDAKPPAATSDLHADVETFCSAEAAEHVAGGLPDLGPYLEPKLHDTDVKKILLGLKDGKVTIPEAQAQIDALVASEHVTACPTRDKLFAPKT